MNGASAAIFRLERVVADPSEVILGLVARKAKLGLDAFWSRTANVVLGGLQAGRKGERAQFGSDVFARGAANLAKSAKLENALLGMSRDRLELAADEIARRYNPPAALETLIRLHDGHADTVLVSDLPMPIVDAFRKRLGLAHAIGREPHYSQEHDLTTLSSWDRSALSCADMTRSLSSLGLSLAKSTVYIADESDIVLFRDAAAFCVVNPSKGLALIAEQEGWPTVYTDAQQERSARTDRERGIEEHAP